MVISRSAEGKLVESWEVYDTLGMMRQLGLVVIPGPRLLVRMLVGQAKKLGARLPTRRQRSKPCASGILLCPTSERNLVHEVPGATATTTSLPPLKSTPSLYARIGRELTPPLFGGVLRDSPCYSPALRLRTSKSLT